MKPQFPTSNLEIDADKVRENVGVVREWIGSDTRLMAVVKANAYGHGAKVMGPVLDPLVDMMAVATLDEAIELRAARVTSPILVMGVPTGETAVSYVTYDITATISDLSHFSILMDGTRYHLNLDTGMHRLGISPNDWASARQQAILNSRLRCGGVYTHYAMADEADHPGVPTQHAQFEKAMEYFDEIPLKYISNGAASLSGQAPMGSIVRTGLPFWGLSPIPPWKQSAQVQSIVKKLQPTTTWVSEVIQQRPIPAGDCVSYGWVWPMPEDGVILTIPVGYAHGFPRNLPPGEAWVAVQTNGGWMKCLLAGRVTMDYILVYAPTKVPAFTKVHLFGGHGMDAWEMARMAETIPYELCTRWTDRVPREVFHLRQPSFE
ncbi:MAG: alanine racemase [Rhodothermaeota bacterium MED-G64]|nr:MAG: alanine racemase [Rhodothermaeota bacterium MED-G64]HBD42208.1 alanine racemase [Bacteroidota bacterium]